MVLNAVPVLGQGKMFIETLIEKDLATGQRVNPYEHAAWTIAGSAMGAGNFVRAGAYSAAGMSGSMATMGGTMGLKAALATAIRELPDAYAGIRQASKYLQEMGVSRKERVKYLQSFEPENMVVRQAGQSEFGLRFFSDPARAGGQYLFETFPASKESLAIIPKKAQNPKGWSTMSGFRQFQIRPGATIREGRAASQGPYLPGGQKQKFILDWRSDLIAP